MIKLFFLLYYNKKTNNNHKKNILKAKNYRIGHCV